MANKLVYTSAPKGLIPGSCGFCTVAGTRGMTKTVVDALEGLAGYRRVYETTDALHRNPVAFSHLMVATPRGRLRVLARIAEAQPDYSGRTNHIASFLQLEEAETPKRGPAYLFSQPGLFETQWPNAQPPIAYPAPIAIPMEEDTYPRPCEYWRVAVDDPGWAGVLASTIETRRLAILVVRPTIDVLKLFQEAIALLPANQRWNATFATYYTNTLKNVDCLWRGVVAGSPEEAQARATAGALILDFAALPSIETFKTNPTIWRWIEIARQPVDKLAPISKKPVAVASKSQTAPRSVSVPPPSAKSAPGAVPSPATSPATPPPQRKTSVPPPPTIPNAKNVPAPQPYATSSASGASGNSSSLPKRIRATGGLQLPPIPPNSPDPIAALEQALAKQTANVEKERGIIIQEIYNRHKTARRIDAWMAKHRKLWTLISWLLMLPWIVYLLCVDQGIIDVVPWSAKDEPVATVPVEEEPEGELAATSSSAPVANPKKESSSESPFDLGAFEAEINEDLKTPRENLQKYQGELASFWPEHERLMTRCQVLKGVATGAKRYRDFGDNGALASATSIEKQLLDVKSRLNGSEARLSGEISQAETFLEEFKKEDLQTITPDQLQNKREALFTCIKNVNDWKDDFDYVTKNGELLRALNRDIDSARDRIAGQSVNVFSLGSLKLELPQTIAMNRFCKSFDVLVDDLATTTSPAYDPEFFRKNLLEQITKGAGSRTSLDKRIFALYSSKEELKNGFYVCFIDTIKNGTMSCLEEKVMKFVCRFDGDGANGISPDVEMLDKYVTLNGPETKSVFAFVLQEADDPRQKDDLLGVLEIHLPDEAVDALVGE